MCEEQDQQIECVRFSDETLLRAIQSVRLGTRRLDVQLLVMLAEVEERRLHLRLAFSSIFEFCRRKLHMSEGEASRRMYASRLVRKLPSLIPYIEAGRIHLTTLLVLRDILTETNIEQLVAATEGKTKNQVKELLAARAPRPDVPSRIRKLPDRTFVSPIAVPSVLTASATSILSTPLDPASASPPLDPASASPPLFASSASPPLSASCASAPLFASSASLPPTASTPPTASSASPLPTASPPPSASTPRWEPASPFVAASVLADARSPSRTVAPSLVAAASIRLLTHAENVVVPNAAEGASHAPARPVSPRRTPGRIEPLSPARYKLEMTIGAEEREKLERARALMRHRLPSGNLAAIFGEALDLLVAKLVKERLGATSRPRDAAKPAVARTAKPIETSFSGEREARARSRHVPRAIRRAVFERDGERCTFHDAAGHRCSSRSFLELDHVHAFGRGGEPSLENLRVRCRAHNRLHAEDTYGAAYVASRVARQRQHSVEQEPHSE